MTPQIITDPNEMLLFILKSRSQNPEVQNPSCFKNTIMFQQSVMIWGAMSSAAVSPLCYQVQSHRSRVEAGIHAK